MRNFVSRWSGAFRVPARMMDYLAAQLAGHPRRVEATALAALVMRVWCSPKLIGRTEGFPLSRREIANILGLSEHRTRQAIAALLECGFLTRSAVAPARRTHRGIRRPPTLYRLCMAVLGFFRRLISKRPPISNATHGKFSLVLGKERISPEGILMGGGSNRPSAATTDGVRDGCPTPVSWPGVR